MEKIINFIGEYYVWILSFTIILIFALIGYICDSKREKNDLIKKQEKELDEESLENLIIPEDKSLADSVSVSKNINPETKKVELTDETIINNENTNKS